MGVGTSAAQQLPVTFRYVAETPVYSVTLPGTFNGWNNGSANAMTFVDSLGQWIKTQTLAVGAHVEYKYFVRTSSSQAGSWITDPNNPINNPADNFNSVLTVTDPLVFQLAEQKNAAGLVTRFSAGVFASSPITSLTYVVGNGSEQNGIPKFNPTTGILSVDLAQPVVAGTLFKVVATSSVGTKEAHIGALSDPISWVSVPRKTTGQQARLRARVALTDGTVDPSITTATLLRNGVQIGPVSVQNGVIDETVTLVSGANNFALQAQIGTQNESSSSLLITQRPNPVGSEYVTATVTGSGNVFEVSLTESSGAPGFVSIDWALDTELSTAPGVVASGAGLMASGSVQGPGEVYMDLQYNGLNGAVQKSRVAVKVLPDGTARTLEYAETAAWINQAVVYEIFPLSFGPSATGTEAAPGTRFTQITSQLEYIRAMGFNTIWFMPIMKNQSMTELSGGYNVLDFYQVDPKLGTNEDFKQLVQTAHALGIRIVLDLTINHVSPGHAWVESLRNAAEFSGFIQTVPNNHAAGLDGRGASLPEQWEENNLYRAYDGFGGLANLNYSNEDLKAEMFEVVQFWLNEFEVDGFRMDAYWGPWRRYGPVAFGVPLRKAIRNVRPDAWILAEIEGVGNGTEAYYADDVNGSVKFKGGIDSGYDWSFSGHVNNPSKYGRLNEYPNLASNYNFSPGPNARYFRFLENHDWSRIQQIFSSSPDRIKPLTGLLLSVPGIPMIYQGQEVGYGDGMGDTRRLPVTWNTPSNTEWAFLHRYLATARAAYPAFGTQDIEFLNTTGSVLSFVRPYPNQSAVVLINFAGTPQTVTVNPSGKVMIDYDGPIPYTDLATDSTAFYVGSFTVTVPPYKTVIYVTESGASLGLSQLPTLPFNASYTATEREVGLPEGVALHQNYPNPFNPTTSISFSIPQAMRVELGVFDILGRQVALLASGNRMAGTHTVSFDGAGLSSGMYVFRLNTESSSLSRTMILLK